MSLHTENYTGASATGTDGQANRVLTLSNTSLTLQEGFLVFKDGLNLTLTTQYTAVHNVTGTTITFIDATWDSQLIIVSYNDTAGSASTPVYASTADVYTITGLSSTEVDATTLAYLIFYAEQELELITGRKFTNANAKTEYFDGQKKDIMGISGNQTITINTSEYPLQSITAFELQDTDGNATQTFATLTSAQIAAGTYQTTDYWLNVTDDILSRNTIPYGKITLKSAVFTQGEQNIKIAYTYGYTAVPSMITNLAACMAGIRAWVRFTGGQYNRINDYSIPQQSVSKGDFYSRVKQNIDILQMEVDRILDRVGRRSRTLFAVGGTK